MTAQTPAGDPELGLSGQGMHEPSKPVQREYSARRRRKEHAASVARAEQGCGAGLPEPFCLLPPERVSLRVMSDVTHILDAIQAGEPQAASKLLPLVYDELRQLAAQRMAQEKPGQTLEATALVHEAYLRLVGDGLGQRWDHRGHFFAAAAEAMRRILVDVARRKQAVRHGGTRRRLELHDYHRITQSPDGMLALDDALTRFADEEPAKSELVKLRFFAGLSTPEAAVALGISLATAERWWAYARTWLFSELKADPSQEIFPS
jgi:RNA polymerase sigma factor (TIGR02999 family)